MQPVRPPARRRDRRARRLVDPRRRIDPRRRPARRHRRCLPVGAAALPSLARRHPRCPDPRFGPRPCRPRQRRRTAAVALRRTVRRLLGAVILAFGLGVATILVASSAVVLRSDVKGGLAWSTVAQMAFMVVQCAVGAFSSAVFHIAGHGMYKAALFLGAGDTAAAGLRSRRRPPPDCRSHRRCDTPLVASCWPRASALVAHPRRCRMGAGYSIVFAWLSLAFGLDGWLGAPVRRHSPRRHDRHRLRRGRRPHLVGLRLVEEFVTPSLAGVLRTRRSVRPSCWPRSSSWPAAAFSPGRWPGRTGVAPSARGAAVGSTPRRRASYRKALVRRRARPAPSPPQHRTAPAGPRSGPMSRGPPP